ncbi:hypothetical protein AB0M36_17790 [Actinoplanes sp. NPDC051346]|uniref:hypothetical protein n=1 Tax=Actinoplanes sp. NPDC051346 TaxID=3155048 RepID=UPI00342E8BAA
MSSSPSAAAAGLHDDSVVELFHLHVGDSEHQEHEVGRVDTGVFVALPAEGVALVKWFAAGLPLRQVRRRFVETYGEPPDITAFLGALAACGFVRSVDGRPYPPDGPGAEGDSGSSRTRGVRIFADLPRERVAWLLSRPMRSSYQAVWAAVAVLLIVVPWLRPIPGDALLLPGVLTNAVVMAALGWVLVLFHEMAHAIAVRALGCVGRLSLSHRLWFLVAQTEMSGVRAVPRARRYAAYLAGMTWDLCVVFTCLCLQLAGLAEAVPRSLIYLLSLSMIFQLSVFMRTDMYFVVAERLRVGNLMRDTRRFLTARARRTWGIHARDDLSDIPRRELTIIGWYAPVYLVGTAATLSLFALLTVPATLTMLRIAASGLFLGPKTAAFWEGVGFIALVAAHGAAWTWSMVTERRRR